MMSRFSTPMALVGTFCLIAAFALALPGVEIARADDAAPRAEREEFDRFLEEGGQRAVRVPGSSCEDRAAGGPSGGQLAAERIARIQRELAARLAAGHGPPLCYRVILPRKARYCERTVSTCSSVRKLTKWMSYFLAHVRHSSSKA